MKTFKKALEKNKILNLQKEEETMKKGLFLKSVKFNSFNRIKVVSMIFVFLMILLFYKEAPGEKGGRKT